MRQVLDRNDYIPGRRVYVADLDVFGRIHVKEHPATKGPIFVVVCEFPMPGFLYDIEDHNRHRIFDVIASDPEAL